MSIGYPWALTLLLSAVLLAFYFRHASGRDVRARETFAEPGRLPKLGLGRAGWKALAVPILVVSAAALTSASLARPLGATGKEGEKTAGMDVVVALDVSDSMGVADIDKDRLTAAKVFVSKLVQAAPGNRYGLVLFSGDVVVSCPLTMDHDAFLTFLDDADFARANVPGTAIGEGILSAATRFRRDALPRAVLVVSDGENTYGADPVDAAGAAKEKGLKVYTVGVGTPAGGRIPVGLDFFGNVRYKTDREGRVVNSGLDEDTLGRIASTGGGRYFSADAGAVGGLAKELSVKGGKKVKDPFKDAKEYGPYLALAAFVLIAAAIVV